MAFGLKNVLSQQFTEISYFVLDRAGVYLKKFVIWTRTVCECELCQILTIILRVCDGILNFLVLSSCLLLPASLNISTTERVQDFCTVNKLYKLRTYLLITLSSFSFIIFPFHLCSRLTGLRISQFLRVPLTSYDKT